MKVICAIGAHHDDIEVLCGGTLAKCVDKGYKVVYAITSNTPYYYPFEEEISKKKYRSNNEITRLRKEEAIKAAEILGINNVYFFDFKSLYWYPDNIIPNGTKTLKYLDGVNSTEDDIKYLNEKIDGREFLITAHRTDKALTFLCNFFINNNIDTIFTNSPDDLHWEHSLNSNFVIRAVHELIKKHGRTINIYAFENGTAGKILKCYTPTHYVDISETIEVKLKSLRNFLSQSPNHSPEIFSKEVKYRARKWGEIFGKKYVEVFTKLNSIQESWQKVNKLDIYDISKAQIIL